MKELEWPVEQSPTLVLFESDEPHFYSGDLTDSEAVTAWVRNFVQSGKDDGDESSGDIDEEFSGAES